MLFNSPEFLFILLPFTVLLFYLTKYRVGLSTAICTVIVSSLIFYGWWSPFYATLLVFWIFINAGLAYLLIKAKTDKHKQWMLVIGIAANLLVLAYFKYSLFLIENLNLLLGANFNITKIILPIGISFFTFQKIAFLVDVKRGEIKSFNIRDYLFFVTFFPQLIAGPIVHYRELTPQLAQLKQSDNALDNISIGLTMFLIGLFKKSILADSCASYADPIFQSLSDGQSLSQASAVVGAMAYTLQLYFDFSGYSDMALGAARAFGIILPINFNSPYKSTSIIDFWRRWHITLSRFFRDYLYVPLGGNKVGPLRRNLNLLCVMVLAGLWHGAAWNFVLWGSMHGLMLVVNHGWRKFFPHPPKNLILNECTRSLTWLVTFCCVVLAWIPFRADTFKSAIIMMKTTIGIGVIKGLSKPDPMIVTWLLCMLAICLILPNTYELFKKVEGALTEPNMRFNHLNSRFSSRITSTLAWQPTLFWSLASAIFLVAFLLTISRVSPFLYFQF